MPIQFALRALGGVVPFSTTARDLAVRILVQSAPATPRARDLAVRIQIVTNPSSGTLLFSSPAPAGPALAGAGLVPLPAGSPRRYANGGVTLVTQPYLATAPIATSGRILSGSAFTLAFASADAATRALLGTPGLLLPSFTFMTSEGAALTGVVVVTSTQTLAGNNLLVTLTLTQDALVNQWVVGAQSL